MGMLFVGLLLFGCANQATPIRNTTQPSSLNTTTPQTQNTTAAAGDSGCTSLYDGTWQGTISNSGSLLVTRYTDGEPLTTHNPFTAQYDFEMTIKCDSGDSEWGWQYNVTHVKASHPLFDCASGCVPLPRVEYARATGDGINVDGSWVYISSNGTGSMYIVFPNDARISLFGMEEMQFSPDGEKVTLNIYGGTDYDYIGWQTSATSASGEFRDIETDNCKRLGGEGTCIVEYINKNTIILSKVS
jgi:hypothetical protein